MSSLRAELGGAIGILLVLYTIQVQRGPSTLTVTIWIDNAEVLERAKAREVGENINKYLVLDYDLWQAMTSMQALISTPLTWEKVDSHIEGKVYTKGVSAKGDQHSIKLNKVMDGWAGTARKGNQGQCTQYFYPESGVMVKLPNKCYV